MFFAILFRTTHLPKGDSKQLDQKILSANINKITVYLPYGDYTLWIISDGDVPESLREQIKPVIIETGIEKPLNAYQHYYHIIEDLFDPIDQLYLMSLKSKLGYAVSENLAPDNFYFSLEFLVDDVSNRRKYIYHLMYNDIKCFTLIDDPLVDNFKEVIKPEMGVLIASTFSLDFPDVPRWYIRETFRDLIYLDGINMTNKIAITGPNSNEVYLFYKEPSNLTEDVVQDLSTEIHGRIRTSINLNIFPRNTPREIIQAKRLVPTKQAQYTFSFPVPNDISLLKEILRYSFSFDTLLKLFWFLCWLQISPTYAFIEKELRIYLRSDEIRICYETKYLPDFLRVRSAVRISPEKQLSRPVELYYPDNMDKDVLDKNLMGKTYLHFFDSENNSPAMVACNLADGKSPVVTNVPILKREYPSDFSLESRIEYDVNPAQFLTSV